MQVEILKKPELLIEEDTAHHVMAVAHETIEGQKVSKVAAEVAVGATTHKRYLEDTIHPATIVQGIVGNGLLYEKMVANTGPFTSLVYGLRLGIAKRKAARYVTSALKA